MKRRPAAASEGHPTKVQRRVEATTRDEDRAPADLRLWYQIDRGFADMLVKSGTTVSELRKKIKEDNMNKLNCVDAIDITIKTQNGKALEVDKLIDDVLKQGGTHTTSALYVHYEQPSASAATGSVSASNQQQVTIERIMEKLEALEQGQRTLQNALRPALTSSYPQLWGEVATQSNVTIVQVPDLDGDPAVCEDDMAALADVPNEEACMKVMLPHLKKIFPHPDLIIDSHHQQWPGFGNCKPDLFRALVYQNKDAGNAGHQVGIPYARLLDCLTIMEAKTQIANDGRGQLYNYLSRLPNAHARGMVFDKTGFELMHAAGDKNSRKAVVQLISGTWTQKGTRKYIRDFLLANMSREEALMRQAFMQTGTTALRFLGSGGCGRVYEVQAADGSSCAMKLVLPDPPGFSPGKEIESMLHAHNQGCPVVRPLDKIPVQVMKDGSLLGYYYRFADVGEPISLEKARGMWKDILEHLRALHLKGFAHGDARLENVIMVKGTLQWIDFLESPCCNPETMKEDVSRLMCQLLGEEKRLDFTNFADRWPKDESYLVEVLQPQLGDMVHA